MTEKHMGQSMALHTAPMASSFVLFTTLSNSQNVSQSPVCLVCFAVLVLLTRNVIKLRKVPENDCLVPFTLIDSATTATSFFVFLPPGVD